MKRILIADNDHSFAELLASRLRAKGLQAETAFDAVQTLKAVLRHSPDAIVLEVRVPISEELLTLRRLCTLTASTPVVVVTASADPALPRAVANFGVKAFLRKPVSAEEVHATLRWAMGEGDAPARFAPDEETPPEREPRSSVIPILGEAVGL
ncbi:MAG TPA: response regulator [Thermoanaerobaculia bacterium]|jgi:DNA-binding response OmpR family regulator|nr:response regulator [Thermoanaerobaculia bacterium]